MEPKRRQMDVTDRIVIDMGLYANRSIHQIAKTLNRHSKTIQRDVLNNRTFIPGPFMINNNDCKYARTCVLRNICEDDCSESRSHIHVRGQELRDFDEFITQQIMKGQPIFHIYAEHGDELPVTMRMLCNYIVQGQ